MKALILAMIVITTTAEYFIKIGFLPRVVKYLPELISGIALVYIVFAGVRTRFRFVRPGYWFVFCAIVLVMLCGAIANSLEPGPMVAGIRNYLKAMPLFFLPAVYAFSVPQIRGQLVLLLLICLSQLPIAIMQRMASLSTGEASGDNTQGTLLSSGLLSVFLVCCACVLTAIYLKKRMKLHVFMVLFILVLLPTAINETKATVFLLPLGLMMTFLAGSPKQARLKNAAIAVASLCVFGAIFVPIYNSLIAYREYGTSISDFFTNPKKFESYMNRSGGEEDNRAGRLEALVFPLKSLARDPPLLVFGLGIGNASDSSLGDDFIGKYYQKYQSYLVSSGTLMLLELGVLGCFLIILLYSAIYRDSRAMTLADEGLLGALAAGWAGVVVVIAISTFYGNLVTSNAISYLFWYFSGVVAAHRVRLAMNEKCLATKPPTSRGQLTQGSRIGRGARA